MSEEEQEQEGQMRQGQDVDRGQGFFSSNLRIRHGINLHTSSQKAGEDIGKEHQTQS